LVYGSLNQKLIKHVVDNQIDIIHCHFADVAWDFYKVPLKTKKKLVISFYGWDYEKLPYTKPEYHQRFNTLFRQAVALICEGKHGFKTLVKLGCPSDKIHVVHLGVEPEKIPFHKRDKKRNELKLVQIASFTEKKGHIYTVKAFAKALKTCPDLELTLVGDIRDLGVKDVVERFIQEQNLAQKIQILDFVSNDMLHEFLKDYHVFIHPSCYAQDRDCEGGAPIVLLDCQATGMPVISTRHCDIPEEVIHNKTGLLAAEKDIFQLALHIERFYEMENLEYQEFSKAASLHVWENYNVEQSAAHLRAIYDHLLSTKE
jgi:colanic acid/amylovoran biosynthesis glycosyltransferase